MQYDLARAECPFQRGSDLAGIGDVYPLPAQGLHHAVVARIGQRGADGALRAEERELRVADLSPAAVIAHDHRHGQPEAHGRLQLHAVQAEGAVAGDEEHAVGGAQQLSGDGEGRPHPEAAEAARIQPLPGASSGTILLAQPTTSPPSPTTVVLESITAAISCAMR